MEFKKIGIVIADRDEYRPFAERIDFAEKINCYNMNGISFKMGNTFVLALLCGIGKVNAASATTYLVEKGCDLVLNFGLSGGLEGAKKGEFCLPETFLEHDFDLTGLGYAPCEKPGQDYIYKANKSVLEIMAGAIGISYGGTAVTGDSFICDSIKSAELVSRFSATCCDMESAAIASVCHMAGVPFAVLRRISDDAGDNAAENYTDVNTNESSLLGNAFYKCLAAIINSKEKSNG